MAADLLAAWRESLMAWAIPDEILARATESPWKLPRELFTRRADAQMERPQGVSLRRAQEALPSGGWVLDVGAGSGAASLPLAGTASMLVAVDTDAQILEELQQRALRLSLSTKLITGRWPDVAEKAPVVDVVVCSHVLYNVPDIGPFVEALSSHARRRVVVEITAHHPLAGLNPLWRRFHHLERPSRPTWEDAVRAIAALGPRPQVERSRRPDDAAVQGSFAEVVALTRRRLCLSAERDDEIARALQDLGLDPGRPTSWTVRDPELATIWWEPGAPGS